MCSAGLCRRARVERGWLEGELFLIPSRDGWNEIRVITHLKCFKTQEFLENLWLLLVLRFMHALIRKLLTTSRHINSILVLEHKWKILSQFTTHKVVLERSLFGHLSNHKLFFSLPDFANTKTNTLHFMVNFKSMDFYVWRVDAWSLSNET